MSIVSTEPARRVSLIAYGAVFVAAAVVWYGITSGRQREAWDDPIYFRAGYPLLLVVVFCAALLIPPERPAKSALLLGLLPIISHFGFAALAGSDGSSLPLAVLFGMALATPLVGVAYLAHFLRRRARGRRRHPSG